MAPLADQPCDHGVDRGGGIASIGADHLGRQDRLAAVQTLLDGRHVDAAADVVGQFAVNHQASRFSRALSSSSAVAAVAAPSVSVVSLVCWAATAERRRTASESQQAGEQLHNGWIVSRLLQSAGVERYQRQL